MQDRPGDPFSQRDWRLCLKQGIWKSSEQVLSAEALHTGSRVGPRPLNSNQARSWKTPVWRDEWLEKQDGSETRQLRVLEYFPRKEQKALERFRSQYSQRRLCNRQSKSENQKDGSRKQIQLEAPEKRKRITRAENATMPWSDLKFRAGHARCKIAYQWLTD